MIVDDSGAPDATLPVVAKVSSLIEVLRLGGPYKLVNQLWSQFTLIASRVNIDVALSRDEVLVASFLPLVAMYTCSLAHWCCVLVNHFERDVPPYPCSCVWLGKGSKEVQHWIRGAQFRDLSKGADMGEVHISTCLCCRVERVHCQYNIGGYNFDQISRCCCSQYGCCVAAWRSACTGRGFCRLPGKWYHAKLVVYSTFGLRLLTRCLKRTAASVFGSLDLFPMTEFVVNRLEGTETLDCIAFRPALRKAIITNDLSMPGLVDLVANIVGVWPLIVSYLKETGRKDEGDIVVVRSFRVGVCLHHGGVFITFCCFRRRGWTGTCTMTSSLGWSSGCFISF